ncbi:MAG: isoprenyl transferase [Filomicrobium sp.]
MAHPSSSQTEPHGGSNPLHVAIIMDGNGRWARQRGLPRTFGHREGVEAVRRAVRAAIEIGIPYLTIYSFSSENWSRPREEIDYLMGLMKRFIRRDLAELHEANVRICVIGERDGVDPELLALIDEAKVVTRNNTRLTLVIAFNYGGRNEIVRAAGRLAEEMAAGRLDPAKIETGDFERALDTYGIPDPDLLIRTGGEMRLSNFLLWQSAYAEFVFLDIYWPDFGREDLAAAISKYLGRERRYGGLASRSTA